MDHLSGAKRPVYIDAITFSFQKKPETETLVPKLRNALETLRATGGSVEKSTDRAATLNIHVNNFFDMSGAQALLIGGTNQLSWSVRIKDSKSGSPLYQEDMLLRAGYAPGGIVAMIIEASRDDEANLVNKMARVVQARVLRKHNIAVAADVTVAMTEAKPVDNISVAESSPDKAVTPSSPNPSEAAASGTAPLNAEMAATTDAPSVPPPSETVVAKRATLSEGQSDRAAAVPTQRTSETPSNMTRVLARLPNGPLMAEEVKALFSDLAVTTDDVTPVKHSFRRNGRLDGAITGSGPENRLDTSTSPEDGGHWNVSRSGQLCMKWGNWYGGLRHCYQVSKNPDGIALRSGRDRIGYRVSWQQVARPSPAQIDAAKPPDPDTPSKLRQVSQAIVGKAIPPSTPHATRAVATSTAAFTASGRSTAVVRPTPAVTGKSATYVPPRNRSLPPSEVKALFTDLVVVTDDTSPEKHSYLRNGQLNGSLLGGEGGQRPNNGTMSDDSGSWNVSSAGQLCMKWWDWYGGQRQCFRVFKKNKVISLRGRWGRINYEIAN